MTEASPVAFTGDTPFCRTCMRLAVRAGMRAQVMDVVYRRRWMEYAAEVFLMSFDHRTESCTNPVSL